MMDGAIPGDLSVRLRRPLRVPQQPQHGPALVLVRPPLAVAGIGPDREQDRIALRALADIGLDLNQAQRHRGVRAVGSLF